MKLYYNGKMINEIITNRSLNLKEVMYSIGYDVDSKDDLKIAYEKGEVWAYINDEGKYDWDFENLEIK